MAAVELDDAALELIERVLGHYLEQVEPEDVDTQVLAENIVGALTQGEK